jgi:hypothetical protein
VPHLSPTTPTTDEQRLVLRAIVGNVRDHTIVSLALGTGLRLAEIVGLNVGDVFAPDGTPRVRFYPDLNGPTSADDHQLKLEWLSSQHVKNGSALSSLATGFPDAKLLGCLLLENKNGAGFSPAPSSILVAGARYVPS